MKLTLVGLPLGNIDDISIRAVKTLDSASFIICEDTRVFHKLWQKLMNIGVLNHKYVGKLVVINEFNEKFKAQEVASEIDEAVLVSDAGMPLVSDPGYRLVKTVIEKGGLVTTVPGPTAAMSALAISGLSADKVLFLGFLPKKQSKRKEIWEMVKTLKGVTVVLYESPRRVKETVKEIGCDFVIVRELTKEHEEVIRNKVPDNIKGEVVVLFRIK